MSEERAVARRAGTVGAATMLSRVLGLVREQVMASFFGAGYATDAFNVAFRIPNLLRDLLAEGAMSAAFIPTFTEYRETRGPAEAWSLGRHVMVSLMVAASAICVVGIVVAPALVNLMAPGFMTEPGKHELTVLLTRVMMPFLPAVALAAAAMGMLNANGRFGVPALAPSLLNIGMIGFGIGLIPLCRSMGQPPILAMAIGVTLGGVGQFLFQVPALIRLGFRMGWEVPFRHPGMRRIATLMLPATLGLAATNLNLTVSTLLASLLPQGSVSWLWYAFRLMQLPIGVFGVALATVSLPALSRAAVEKDLAALKITLSATLRLVMLLTIPAAFWLAFMARPVIELLYEHGRFGASDTGATAAALMSYAIGLPAFAASGVLTRTFYALGDTRTPVRASFVSVGLNIALNLILMKPLAHVGLALATSVTAWASLLQLAWYLRRRIGPLEGRRIARNACAVSTAGAAGGGICWLATQLLRGVGPRGFAGEMLVVGTGFLLGAGLVYAGLKLLRVAEVTVLEDLVRSLAGRFRRRPAA